MKTVEYKLQSGTHDTINLPQNGMHHAEKIMNIIAKSDNSKTLSKKINKYSYLKDMRTSSKKDIIIKANYLRKTNQEDYNARALKLQDDIYIMIGTYDLSEIDKIVKMSKEEEAAFKGLELNFLERRDKFDDKKKIVNGYYNKRKK